MESSSTSVEVATPKAKVAWVWTTQRILIISICCGLNMLNSICYSMISPFFPPLATQRDVPQYWVGIVFASYQIVMFISSAFWGNRVTKYGPVKIMRAGVITASIGVVAFSSLYYIKTPWLFVLVAFLLRCLEGLGSGMSLTGMLTIVTQEFSEKIGQVTGLLEGTASTTGFMLGPLLGGLMNDNVGFWLPFCVFGCTYMVYGVLISVMFRNYQDVIPARTETDSTPNVSQTANSQDENEKKSLLSETETETESESESGDREAGNIQDSSRAPEVNISVGDMLKTPVVWVVGFCLVAASSSLGLIEVGLSIHIDQVNQATNNTLLSDAGRNALFFISPLAYGTLVFLFGKCIDTLKTYRLFFTVGLLTSAAGCVFVGPAPVVLKYIPALNDPHAMLISTIVSLITIGCGFAFAVTPFVPSLITIAKNKGYPECTATSGAASGCIGVFYCLGQVLGPAVAAPLCGQFSFATAGVMFALAILGIFVLFCILSVVYRKWFTDQRKRKRVLPDYSSTSDSSLPNNKA